MARSLVVEILGDAKQFASELDKAAGKTKKFGAAAGVAGAALGGALVVGLTKSAKAAMDSQKVQSQTESQLKALGISYKAHAGQIDTAIQATSKLAAVDDEDLQTAFNNLVRTSGSVKKGLNDTALAADIARGKGISLQAATKLVTNAELGKAGALTKAGLAAKKGATPLELLNTLHKKFSGAAEAYGKTAAGSQERFKVAVENLEESLGKMLLPTIEKVAGALAKMAGFLEEHKTLTKVLVGIVGALAGALVAVSVATKVWSAATKIAAAMQWLLNAALDANPIGLIVIAIAALVAGLIVAYKKSETFRKAIDELWDLIVKGAKWVLDFFKDHWPEIALLISGPFAPLVALATDSFGIRTALVNAFTAIASFVDEKVKAIAKFITDLPSKIGDFGAKLKQVFITIFTGAGLGKWIDDKIVDFAKFIFNLPSKIGDFAVALFNKVTSVFNAAQIGVWIIGKVKDFAGFFAELPGKIGSAISGAMGDLWSAFKKIFDPGVWKKKILDFLGFGSPSPFFVDVGKNIIGSIAHGVGKFSGVVWDAVKKIVSDINPLSRLSGGGDHSGLIQTGGLSSQVVNALSYARQHGWHGDVTSGFRTYAEQSQLYQRYLHGGPLAAKPGTSSHETGNAVDVSDYSTFGRIMASAPAGSRLYNKLGAIDPVHYSVSGYKYGGTVPGPVGAPQLAVVHGGETITPHGGGTNVVVHVHGSVMSERDLALSIRDELVRAGNRSGGGMLAGTA